MRIDFNAMNPVTIPAMNGGHEDQPEEVVFCKK